MRKTRFFSVTAAEQMSRNMFCNFDCQRIYYKPAV